MKIKRFKIFILTFSCRYFSLPMEWCKCFIIKFLTQSLLVRNPAGAQNSDQVSPFPVYHGCKSKVPRYMCYHKIYHICVIIFLLSWYHRSYHIFVIMKDNIFLISLKSSYLCYYKSYHVIIKVIIFECIIEVITSVFVIIKVIILS